MRDDVGVVFPSDVLIRGTTMPSIALPWFATRLAARQHGVISGQQLLAAGLSRRQVRYRVCQGSLAPMLGDTYRIAGAPVVTSARYISATLAVPGSVLAGAAAAHLLGLPDSPRVGPEVATRRTGRHRLEGVVVHRPRDLLDRHRTRVDGIPVTTIPRTVLDLASRLDPMGFERLIDDLVGGRRITIPLLFDEFDRVARRGRPGTTMLRRLLIPRLTGLVVPPSELERHGLEFLDRHGFEPPLVEFKPPWSGPAIARVDLAYVAQRVVIELDGRR